MADDDVLDLLLTMTEDVDGPSPAPAVRTSKVNSNIDSRVMARPVAKDVSFNGRPVTLPPRSSDPLRSAALRKTVRLLYFNIIDNLPSHDIFIYFFHWIFHLRLDFRVKGEAVDEGVEFYVGEARSASIS